ncbi:MAG: hypothetical protein ACFFHV_06700 [Promethearchaeota archaeon]
MPKKEEIKKEDLKFLKELIGESKKEEGGISNFRKLKDLNEKISVSSIRDGLIQVNKKNEILRDIKSTKSDIEKTDSIYSQNYKNQRKKKKIKKKQLFLEIAEALPLIRQNNILLNELIQALIKEPIKVKILK